jgi:hypothetical protein
LAVLRVKSAANEVERGFKPECDLSPARDAGELLLLTTSSLHRSAITHSVPDQIICWNAPLKETVVISRLKLAALVGLSSSMCLAADNVATTQPSYDELRQEIRQLQSRLDQLETQSQPSPNVDTTVDRVLKDADRRSQLFAADGAITAGYDKGFFIRSEEGNFVLKPGLLAQFRNITTVRTGTNDDTNNGFELRRLRPRIDGNAFTPDFTYSVVLDTNRNGGGVSLLDAWGQYKFAPTWSVKFGQFRESWYHEGDVPDYNQLAVERSLIDAVLGGSQVDRVQGLSLIYGNKEQPVRVEVTYHDGANSKNTDFRDVQPGALPTDPPVFVSNFGTGARVEYKPFGDWADYRDFTAKGTKQNLLVLGAGADLTEAGDTNVLRTTADVQWENTHGLGLYGSFNGNYTDLGTVAAGPDNRFDWGTLVQAGYLVAPAWEVFGRYELLQLDPLLVAGQTTFNEFGVGVNYYLGPGGSYLHRAKVTVDALYLPNGAPSNQTGTGVLANPNGDAEYVLRAQLQLLL